MADYCVIKLQEESRDAYAAIMYAWKGFIDELKNLPVAEDGTVRQSRIFDLIERWNIVEFEADGIERIGIGFPDDIRPEFESYLARRKEKIDGR